MRYKAGLHRGTSFSSPSLAEVSIAIIQNIRRSYYLPNCSPLFTLHSGIKFKFSEKATQIWPIFHSFWQYLVASNHKFVWPSQNIWTLWTYRFNKSLGFGLNLQLCIKALWQDIFIECIKLVILNNMTWPTS